MPGSDQHFTQYKKNRSFLNVLMQQEQPAYDWIVTVAFYTALHLVEKTIAQMGANSADHKMRERFINSLAELRPIRNQYLFLEMESKKSRYYCVPFMKESALASIDQLSQIETVLIK